MLSNMGDSCVRGKGRHIDLPQHFDIGGLFAQELAEADDFGGA